MMVNLSLSFQDDCKFFGKILKYDYDYFLITVHQVEYEVIPIFHSTNSTKKDGDNPSPINAYLETPEKNYTFYLEDNDVLLGSNTPIHWAQFNPKNPSFPQYLTKFYKDYVSILQLY